MNIEMFDQLPCDLKWKIFQMNREEKMRERNLWFHGFVILELEKYIQKYNYFGRRDGIKMDSTDLLNIIDIYKTT